MSIKSKEVRLSTLVHTKQEEMNDPLTVYTTMFPGIYCISANLSGASNYQAHSSLSLVLGKYIQFRDKIYLLELRSPVAMTLYLRSAFIFNSFTYTALKWCLEKLKVAIENSAGIAGPEPQIRARIFQSKKKGWIPLDHII
jgi:hypothetical protein